MKKILSTEEEFQKLKSLTNAANLPLLDTNLTETYQIKLTPDITVKRGLFKPTLNPKEYLAHPATIRSIRADLFMGGEDFVDLEQIISCPSCKTNIDLQFFKHCPYCETDLIF